MDGFAEHFKTLAEAEVVAFGGVGLTSQVLAPTEAYRTVAAALATSGEKLRPQLESLVANGTPAGKLYGASLLRELDPRAADGVWRRLAGDRTPVTTFFGCVMNATTVGQYASDQL